MFSSPLPCILTFNGGSSSIRCALYEIVTAATAEPRLMMRGKIERIGSGGAQLVFNNSDGTDGAHPIRAMQRDQIIVELIEWLEAQPCFSKVAAVGHRVVFGMSHTTPQRITATLLKELQQFISLDPEHLPFEIALIEAMQQRHPALLQVACFDTSFHHTLPAMTKTVPLPLRYRSLGIERYGFHGLSYSYLSDELVKLGDQSAVTGRVIMAHLGSGASLAAIHHGVCIDTSMGFTPASGVMMGTRSGDIDPGIMFFLAQHEGMSVEQIQQLLSHESGMLGVSGISADVRELLERENNDPGAALALTMFCYQVKKYIGSYAAALGGVDTLVFAGGIGERSAPLRQRICTDLQFLGIHIDTGRNQNNAAVISSDGSKVTVRVIRTDEELMLARYTLRLMKLDPAAPSNL